MRVVLLLVSLVLAGCGSQQLATITPDQGYKCPVSTLLVCEDRVGSARPNYECKCVRFP